MSKLIIITDTEEPGTYYQQTSMAVLNFDTDFVHRINALTTDLNNKHLDFSELRLWGSHAEYYSYISAKRLLDALMKIAESDPSKIEPEVVEEMMQLYQDNGSFKWPDNIEFDLVKLLNLTARDYRTDELEQAPEPSLVDIEEVVAEVTDFRCAAYYVGQQVYTKHIPYSWALDEAAI